MKQIRFILLLTILLNSAALFADYGNQNVTNAPDYDTYMGVNYKLYWIKPVQQWQQLFVEPQPGFNVFLGWRFLPYMATEFGYEWTANKPSSVVIPNTASLLGITNTSGTPITITSKVRFKSGFIDFLGFLPFCLGGVINPEIVFSAGVSGMKPCIKMYASPLNSATANFTNQFTTIEGRSKAVFRFGLGLQMLLVENFGARVMWRVEDTSVLRARNSVVTENIATRKLFHDAQSVTAGFFLNFY